MKKINVLISSLLACFLFFSGPNSFAQCCNVITSNGVSVVTTNTICVSTVYASATACLDSDGDGVMDSEDKCPAVKGLSEMAGCPDSDGDKVADNVDKCPTVAGLAALSGCPDADNDGITDLEDKCPSVKGLASFGGCADTDGDGVEDSKDSCPKVAGSAALSGCPDKDNDGVADNVDKCPDVAGLASEKGCPKISEEITKKAAKSAKGVYFETGKDIIKKESIDDMDMLASILKEDASLTCGIEGHTDNAGVAAKNLELSQKRADACKAYLVSKGIDASRLTSTGFGDTKPVEDNKTAAGKAKNRRVEFKLGH